MKRLLYFTAVIFCLIGTQFAALAGGYSLSDYLSIQNVTVGSAIVLNDPQYQVEIEYTSGQQYDITRALKVRLAYGRQSQSDRSVSGTLPEWKIKIRYTVHDDVVGTSIGNNYLTILSSNGQPVYESVNMHTISSGVVSVGIDEIDYLDIHNTPLSTSQVQALIPADIQLEAIEEVTKFTLFDPTATTQLFLPAQANAHQLITWDFIEGAESYDLEWVYVDAQDASYNDAINIFSGHTDPFSLNDPVRINTTDNYYNLDMTYPDGAIFFRVRGVGRFLQTQNSTDDASNLNYGNWIYKTDLPVFVSVGTAFESTKTWELVKSYAEEGKNKKVITYYDESSRSRQSVTNLSTNGTVAVAEKKYDYEGRPVVSILPFPITGIDLSYKPSLEKNGSGNVFSKVDFDAGTANTLATSSGAGQYYSPQMPSIPNSLNQGFTPDAHGYPYTQVIYDRDNRNRPVRQSGVGSDHTLYGSHDTKYYYETAKEEELYRLFGSNVGKVNHYKKNYVQDANGQLSVSYLDQEGRTIATALAGGAPFNLNPLAYSTPSQADTSSLVSNNLYDANNQTVTSSSEMMNTLVDNQYDFFYDINKQLVDAKPCLNCIYHLQITITDPQGRDVIGTTPNDGSVVSNITPSNALVGNAITQDYSVIIQNGVLCPSGFPTASGETISFSVRLHQIGPYTVNKVLSVVQPSADQVRAMVAADPANASLLDTVAILKNLLDSTNFNTCNVTCEDQCKNSSDPDCIAKCQQKYISIGKDSVVANECEGYLAQMKLQMSPGGVYYELWRAQRSTSSSPDCSDPHHISPANVLGMAQYAQNIVAISATGDTLFRRVDGTPMATGAWMDTLAMPDLFQSSWADALVLFHPEYCHYALCSLLATGGSKDYDTRMAIATTQAQAQQTTVLYNCDPMASATPDPVNGLAYQGNSFSAVTLSFGTNTGSHTFDYAKQHYYYQNLDIGPLWDALAPPASTDFITSDQSGTITGGTLLYDPLDLNNQARLQLQQGLYANMDPNNPDLLAQKHWTLYRGFYLQLKQRYLDGFTAAICTACCQSPTGYIPDTLTYDPVNYPNVSNTPYSFTIFTKPNYGDGEINSLLASSNTTSQSSAANIASLSTLSQAMMAAKMVQDCNNHCPEAAKTWMEQLVPDQSGVVEVGSDASLFRLDRCIAPFVDWHISGASYSSPLPSNTQWDLRPNVTYNNVLTEMRNYCLASCSTLTALSASALQAIAQSNIGSGYVPPIDNSAINGSATPQLSATLNSLISDGTLATSCVEPNPNCDDRVYYWMSQIQKRCDGLTSIDTAYIDQQLGGLCVSVSNIFNDNMQLTSDYLQTLYNAPNNNIYVHNIENTLNAHGCSILNGSIGEGFTNSCILSPCFAHFFINAFDNNSPSWIQKMDSDVWISSNALDSMNNCLATAGNVWASHDVSAIPSSSKPFCVAFTFFTSDGTLIAPNSVSALFFTSSALANSPIASPRVGYKYSGFYALGTVDGITDTLYFYQKQDSNSCDVDFVKCDYSISDWKKTCIAFLENKAEYQMQEIYKDRLDSLVAAYYDQYKLRCFTNRPQETFTVAYPLNEYHYTLYYYDQAGNLVQTVPPEGVYPVSDQGSLSRLALGTYQPGDQPPHKLLTTYQYNSLNQVISQTTPDGGTTTFWYNSKGQLRLSQNAKQVTAGTFSFTLYDGQGRIISVGEAAGTPPVGPSTTATIASLDDQGYLSYPMLPVTTLNSLTTTIYDIGAASCGPQDNLRGRVAQVISTTVPITSGLSGSTAASNTTSYSYDPHGNVKTLYQTGGELTCSEVDYDYDLISGKVNQVDFYNDAASLEYHHRYEYDADNRITNVYTSHDNVIWDEDADYFYYPHGPLARTELGQDKVQGLDYYYTIHGWLKGVNKPGAYPETNNTYSTSLASYDPGLDGYYAMTDNGARLQTNSYVAQDQLSYQLGYYSGDYAAAGTYAGADVNSLGTISAMTASILPASASTGQGLYNGNIVAMVTDMPAMAGGLQSDRIAANSYQYDQLNRINNSLYYSYNQGTWTAGGSKYATAYRYDMNGNIRSLTRNDQNGSPFDQLTYAYNEVGATLNCNIDRDLTQRLCTDNKLNYVHDGVSGPPTYGDITSQSPGNYTYDEIGNLTGDASEGNMQVKWNVYGKIQSITKGTTSPYTYMEFSYDGAGNRVTKYVGTIAGGTPTFTDKTTYVRDASGNIMATYDHKLVVAAVGNPADINYQPPQWSITAEYPLYGSSRLGVYTDVIHYAGPQSTQTPDDATLLGTYRRVMQQKHYELTDHLGNVMATISDLKYGYSDATTGLFKYYKADVGSAQDYFPFGMQMPGRVWNSAGYRFGFNGKEQDPEPSGQGNQYDYGFRIYNPRLGKFLSVDPLTKNYPWYTPYQFAGNSPIFNLDRDGKEELPYFEKESYKHSRNKRVTFINNTIIAFDNSIAGIWNTGYELLTNKITVDEVIWQTQKGLDNYLCNNLGPNGPEPEFYEDFIGGGAAMYLGGKVLPGQIPKPVEKVPTITNTALQLDWPAVRQNLAHSFYEKFGERNIESKLAGIDFSKAVQATVLSKGTQIMQWVGKDGKVGKYFAPLGTDPSTLGIDLNAKGGSLKIFTLTEDVNVLKSTANDYQGNKGGATQYFSPELPNKVIEKNEAKK